MVPIKKDYNILGSILELPCFRKRSCFEEDTLPEASAD